jgi:hypothetical protein
MLIKLRAWISPEKVCGRINEEEIKARDDQEDKDPDG